MWNGRIVEKEFAEGLLKVVVNYSDGTISFRRLHSIDNQQSFNFLGTSIIRFCRHLSAIQGFYNTLVIGALYGE